MATHIAHTHLQCLLFDLPLRGNFCLRQTNNICEHAWFEHQVAYLSAIDGVEDNIKTPGKNASILGFTCIK